MMLLEPSPGEIVDRMTILELKIQHAGENSSIEWAREYEILKKKLDWVVIEGQSHRDKYVVGAVVEYHKSLQLVNKVLWEAEDELRSYPDEIHGQLSITVAFAVARCAKKISAFNDRRMDLVREINTLFNQKDAAQGAQKIYNPVKV